MGWSPYLENIEISSRRVLTLLNRNDYEETSGCFDRNYWHFKTRDYPSAIYQMGIAVLAKLWKLEESEYYKNQSVLHWIEQGIKFLSKIQKKDGSFDEWYVNERGWGGPTGYLMNACLDTYEIIGHALSEESQKTLVLVITKGISFLKKSTEGHVLANHVAIVLLPMIQAKILLGLELNSEIEKLIESLERHWIAGEGWSLEYDGADPGYQSGTLSFLAKALKYESNEKIKEICLRSLEFISYFAYPSGASGGGIGSRHTVTFFCAGIEAFRDTPLGARMSLFSQEALERRQVVLSSDLDDHYLFYRIYEFLDAHGFYLNKKLATKTDALPFEKEDFVKDFGKAGIRVGKTNHSYWIVSFKRGGAVRVENIEKKKMSFVDNGIFLADDKKIFSSLWQDISTLSTNTVSGNLIEITPKVFTPLKQIVFRIIMLLIGFHHKSALWLKDMIRKMLIFGGENKSFPFERSITVVGSKMIINTKINIPYKVKVRIGGEFWSRYVPQSRHYLREQLESTLPYFEEETSKNIDFTKEVEL